MAKTYLWAGLVAGCLLFGWSAELQAWKCTEERFEEITLELESVAVDGEPSDREADPVLKLSGTEDWFNSYVPGPRRAAYDLNYWRTEEAVSETEL